MIPLAVPCQKRGDDWVGGINTDSDPFFSNVISLLHFNGLEGSQDIVDEIGNTWNIYAQVGADPSVGIELSQHGIDPAFVTNFNTAEYLSSSQINMDSGLDFFMLDSANGDCTVEWFFKYSANATGWLLFSSAGDYPTSIAGGFRVALQSGQIAILGEYQAPAEDGYNMPSLTVSLDFIPHSLWHHIALVISGSTLKCFINGVLRDSATIQRSAGFNYTTGETIIRLSDIVNGMANNSITTDEFRITIGVARYSSNFARPIKQFPDHA